jgi:hypothetical protein
VPDKSHPSRLSPIAESTAFDLTFLGVWLVFFCGPPATQSRLILTFTARGMGVETAELRERDRFDVQRKSVLYRAKVGSNCVIFLTIEANFVVQDRVSRIVWDKTPEFYREHYPARPSTQNISQPSHGVDELALERVVHLGSQTPDVNIDDVAIPLEGHVPDLLCDQRSREHIALMFQQQRQKQELLESKLNSHATSRHLLTPNV